MRRKWKPDGRGYYNRSIGWEQSKSGKIQQHKFILGTDLREAEKRERKLREIWDSFTAGCDEERPFWTDDLMAIAKRVAKGVPDVPIPRGPQERVYQYAARIQRIQAKYPVILFKPEDEHTYEVGLAALEMFESELIAAPSLAADGLSSAPLFGRMRPSDPSLKNLHEAPQVDVREGEAEPIRSASDEGNLQLFSATLHQAFDSYQKHIKRECYLPAIGHVSAWGNTQTRQVSTLKRHHEDRLLTTLNGSVVDEMIGHWRRRPCKHGGGKPMTSKTASNYLSTLVRFFKWLHNSSEFEWSKPFAFSDMNTRVRRLPEDHAKKSLEQVDTFSLEELRLLMRYGQPFDRLLLLLALNCGFGRAEIASLRIGEIHLFKGHTKREQELLGYKTTSKDSFVKRVRPKNFFVKQLFQPNCEFTQRQF